MKLVAGLGNPGASYQCTWHNVGFLIVDEFLRQHQKETTRELCHSLYTSLSISEETCWVIKPQLFMNRSGEALVPFVQKKGITPSEVLVIHDDIDLEPGRFQIKLGGGSGGHRGLESILQFWNEMDFYRLRVGVGRGPEGMDPADFVLKKVRVAELKPIVIAGVEALKTIFEAGPKKAMNQINRKLPNP